ncbi:MAG: baseplate J/gp47 family protein [Anaerolineales bacterium]|nr:baseplate J/gp47 family protein [Anaerolineales bacterium]
MKEQILVLDPHDDYHSARDKMGWVQTQRVVLIWPPRGNRRTPPPLARPLDLVLLHRHAHRLGAQLALVTKDDVIRENANALGLATFDSLEATRRMRWRSRVPKVRPPRRHARPDTEAIRRRLHARRRATLPPRVALALRISVFSVGLFALFALLFAVIPSATITLTPVAQPLAADVEITADPNLQSSVIPHTIPARTVRVEVQGSQLIATTGVIDVPDARAQGTVVFSNIAGTPALIPQGTSVRTSTGTSVRFVTRQAVNIEGRIGATVEVPIEAVERGTAGNVAAGLINAIDGPLGTQLAVTNPAPTTGGTTQQRAAVAEADRIKLRELLLAQLQLSAAEAVAAQLQPGEFFVNQTLTVTNVLAETFDHAVGEAADALGLTLRVAATGLAVNENAARKVAEAALQAQLPPGATLSAGSLRFERDPALTLDEAGRVRFTMRAEGSYLPQLERETVRALARSRRVDDAARALQAAFPLSAAPQIALSPAWLAQWYPYLPWLPIRIEVIVR